MKHLVAGSNAWSDAAPDVASVIGCVRDNGFELSVQAGGHNIAGLGLPDEGVTLDMALMRLVDVDVAGRTATVGPGCTLGDVDQATQQRGLATAFGFVSGRGQYVADGFCPTRQWE